MNDRLGHVKYVKFNTNFLYFNLWYNHNCVKESESIWSWYINAHWCFRLCPAAVVVLHVSWFSLQWLSQAANVRVSVVLERPLRRAYARHASVFFPPCLDSPVFRITTRSLSTNVRNVPDAAVHRAFSCRMTYLTVSNLSIIIRLSRDGKRNLLFEMMSHDKCGNKSGERVYLFNRFTHFKRFKLNFPFKNWKEMKYIRMI